MKPIRSWFAWRTSMPYSWSNLAISDCGIADPPTRMRFTVMMLVANGFNIGAAIDGFIAAALIPKFGWRSVFYFGGLVPLVMAASMIATGGGMPIKHGRDGWSLVFRRSAAWLAQNLPDTSLDSIGVENLVEELVVRIARRRFGDGETTTPGQGGPLPKPSPIHPPAITRVQTHTIPLSRG